MIKWVIYTKCNDYIDSGYNDYSDFFKKIVSFYYFGFKIYNDKEKFFVLKYFLKICCFLGNTVQKKAF